MKNFVTKEQQAEKKGWKQGLRAVKMHFGDGEYKDPNRRVIQLPQETAISPIGRQRLHDIEPTVVGDEPVVVQIIQSNCTLPA